MVPWAFPLATEHHPLNRRPYGTLHDAIIIGAGLAWFKQMAIPSWPERGHCGACCWSNSISPAANKLCGEFSLFEVTEIFGALASSTPVRTAGAGADSEGPASAPQRGQSSTASCPAGRWAERYALDKSSGKPRL